MEDDEGLSGIWNVAVFALLCVSWCFRPNFGFPEAICDVEVMPKLYEIRLNLGARRAGPKALALGLLEASRSYFGKCIFTTENAGWGDIEANDNPRRFFYIQWPNDLDVISEQIHARSPKKLRNALFGPLPVPAKWFQFPNERISVERNFGSVMDRIGAWVVHTARVRDHIASRSNTSHLNDKYALVPACTNILPGIVKPWDQREHDVILYEKYADSKRKNEAEILHNMLVSAGLKVLRMSYRGRYGYTHEKMMQYANDAKFIIYFSFYDTGAIGLKEIQNFGIYTFAHQIDQVEDERTGMLVPELDNHDMEGAFAKIKQRMDEINNMHPDTNMYKCINQRNNKCTRSLDDLCNYVRKTPTFAD